MRRFSQALVPALIAITAGLLAMSTPASAAPKPEDLKAQAARWVSYVEGIRDSAVARPSEVVTDLLVPTPADPRTQWRTIDGIDYLLVGAMRYAALSNAAPGESFELGSDRWVFIPGELAERCARMHCEHMDVATLDMRLKALIGLPPDADYSKVTWFWVRSTDLFRPCTDPRPSSPTCPVTVPADAPATVAGIDVNTFLWKQTNTAWHVPSVLNPATVMSCSKDFQNTTNGECLGYPWTRLGYTYDWSPTSKRHRGLTEFVVPKGAPAFMESTGTHRQYFPYERRS